MKRDNTQTHDDPSTATIATFVTSRHKRIAHETAICRNPLIYSFTGDRKEWQILNRPTFNHLKTEHRLFYLKTQFVRGAKWSVLLTQYCAGDKIEKNEMGWACGAYGWERGVYRVLVGKPEGKRPLGRPRRWWVDNIRMDRQEVGCGYMDWIGLAQDRDR